MKRKVQPIRWLDFCTVALLCFFLYEFWVDGASISAAMRFLMGSVTVLLTQKLSASEEEPPRGTEMLLLLAAPLYALAVIGGEFTTQWAYLRYAYCAVLLVELLFCVLTGKSVLSAALTGTVLTLLLIANDIVMQMSGNLLLPSDMLVAGTAFSVAKEYWKDVRLSVTVTGAALGAVILWSCARHKKIRGLKGGWKLRLGCLVGTGAMVLAMGQLVPEDYVPGSYVLYKNAERNGYTAVFALEVRYLRPEEPENYKRDAAAASMSRGEDLSAAHGKKHPNIIVVLDEAFSDLTVLGELQTDRDAMPYFHQLQETAQSGIVYVPVWGNNTCNTEWELLTGNAMAFCPGAMPYTQYISEPRSGVVSHLKKAGYTADAIHPYYDTGYRRDKVYPLLGFETFYSIEHFDERYRDMAFNSRLSRAEIAKRPELYLRNVIKDEASFEKVIAVFEERFAEESPVFIFNLTMQNHGPYNDADYESTIDLDGDRAYPREEAVEQYLTLISETDKALEMLINYFSAVEEDTIILFTGDHQPAFGSAFYHELWQNEGRRSWSEEKDRMTYQVPYVLWSNFEVDLSHEYDVLSSNYLSLLLMDAAGLDSGGWYEFLHEIYAAYPVVSPIGIQNAEGIWMSATAEDPLLQRYEQLQYYRMFDEEL